MIRLALIGCGGMSRIHARAFRAAVGRAKITACVDILEQRARQAAEVLGADEVATDYRQVLEHADAVLVVLPHHLHHPVAMECLTAGKHVLLEKPMANSEQQCLDLIEASKKHRRVLMIAYCMRYHPLVTMMKELLDAKTYGEPFQVSLWTEQLTQHPPDHWASSAAMLGGGQLFSHGCHYIDILLWYLGRPVLGAHMGTNYQTPWMEWEGTSHVTIKFESGAIGYHFGTWGARGTRLGYSFHVHCTEGMLEARISGADPSACGRLIFHQRGQQKLLLECEPGKHTENEMSHFLDCIETGLPPLTDGCGSLQGLRVIWRLYEAERKGVVADLRGLGLDEYSSEC